MRTNSSHNAETFISQRHSDNGDVSFAINVRRNVHFDRVTVVRKFDGIAEQIAKNVLDSESISNHFGGNIVSEML